MGKKKVRNSAKFGWILMKSDVVCTMFALCLYPLCAMFVLCLWYVLMSFDVKMGKINHRGAETQRRSQIWDFRFQIWEDRRKEGGPLGGGSNLEGGERRAGTEVRGRSWRGIEHGWRGWGGFALIKKNRFSSNKVGWLWFRSSLLRGWSLSHYSNRHKGIKNTFQVTVPRFPKNWLCPRFQSSLRYNDTQKSAWAKSTTLRAIRFF